MLRIAGAFAVGLALGVLLGSLVIRGMHAEDDGARGALERSVNELREEQARRWGELDAKLLELRRERDDILVSQRTSSGAREVVASANSTPATSAEASGDPAAALAEVNARILHLEQSVAALTSAVEQRRHLPQFPTAEQLRDARQDADRAMIARISEAMSRDHESGLAMVRYLTFAEVLAKIGRPTTINSDGNWFYERDEGQTLGPQGFELDFVNGYVVQVRSTDE